MSAHVAKPRANPFDGMAPTQIADMLVARGWPRPTIAGGGLHLQLGAVVALVTDGDAGERHLEVLEGARGALPAGPAWGDTVRAGAEVRRRTTRLFRAPEGQSADRLHAENLWGACPGLHVLARGVEELPTRWWSTGHPATTPLPEMPAWLSAMVADPVEARRARGHARATQADKTASEEWMHDLTLERGRPMSTHGNLCTIFRRSPDWAGRFAFSEMSQSPLLDGRPMVDGDIGRIREQLERGLRMTPGEALVRGAVLTVAEERQVHPVRDMLHLLRWDGVARLDRVATDILGAVDPAAAKLVRKWFLSLVARGLRPGCKVDTALVLVGTQGARKSSFFAEIAREFFTDSHVDLSSKDVFLQLADAWIMELAEIDGITSRREVEEIKAFLSSKVDRFRPPYARSVVKSPRHCVVVGTTNRTTFLEDDTGSRRFWCVTVGAIDLELLREQRDQLLAEAVAAYDAGEPWWLDAAEDVEREEHAEKHQVEDPWTGPVGRWLSKSERTDHTSEEILSGALDVPRKDQTKGAAMRLSRVITRLGGWERKKGRPVRDGVRGEPAWLWMSLAPAQPSMGFDDPTEEFPL